MKIFYILISIFFVPNILNAQVTRGIVPSQCEDGNCGLFEFIQLVDEIARWGAIFSTTIATIMFVYAAFLYISAQGDQSKIQGAHRTFRLTLIGFVIILSAYLLIDQLLERIAPQLGNFIQ